MTVAEAIAFLSKFPDDTEVFDSYREVTDNVVQVDGQGDAKKAVTRIARSATFTIRWLA